MTRPGIYATLSDMSRAPTPPVRTPRVLDYSSYAVLVIMGGLGMIGLEGWAERLLALAMCLIFGILYAWITVRLLSSRTLTLVFLVQTAAVTIAVSLHSSAYEAFAFLLMLQAVHVSSMLRPRIGAVWVLGLWAIHGAVTIAFQGEDAWFVVVFNLGIYLVCWVVGHVLRELAVSKDELERTLTRLRRAQEHIRALAVDEERGRLARDLHDSVKQNLFAAGMQIGTARALLVGDRSGAETALDEGDQLIRRAGSDLGLVIHELRPIELDEIGLPAALRNYVCGWSRQTGIEARVVVEAAWAGIEGSRVVVEVARTGAGDGVREAEAVPADVSHAFLRLAQEALSNITRHSGADDVEVRLDIGASIRLSVHDDGVGFVPEQAESGFGLSSMRERIDQLGGRLCISSAPGAGTTVIAEVSGP